MVPESLFAGYSGTRCQEAGHQARYDGGIAGCAGVIASTLGQLPEGASLVCDRAEPGPLAIWFVCSRDRLEEGLPRAAEAVAERGGLWIAWPKQKSGVSADVTQQAVREAGLAAGLVDYKVAALDGTWSGLLFTRRKQA